MSLESICISCEHKAYCKLCDISLCSTTITVCYRYRKIGKTNADRIRNMSDEELADLLDEKIWDLPWCDSDAPIDPETKKCLIWDCKKCALKWLELEVEK